MAQTQYQFSLNSFKSGMSKGFSDLQRCQEFVDMTLAADGYLVKVHKTLCALASPYIKEMIQSVPCAHPVIFLNNVTHKILKYLLEYIYTGEVFVTPDQVPEFIEAAKQLCLVGLATSKSSVNEQLSTQVQDDNPVNDNCNIISNAPQELSTEQNPPENVALQHMLISSELEATKNIAIEKGSNEVQILDDTNLASLMSNLDEISYTVPTQNYNNLLEQTEDLNNLVDNVDYTKEMKESNNIVELHDDNGNDGYQDVEESIDWSVIQGDEKDKNMQSNNLFEMEVCEPGRNEAVSSDIIKDANYQINIDFKTDKQVPSITIINEQILKEAASAVDKKASDIDTQAPTIETNPIVIDIQASAINTIDTETPAFDIKQLKTDNSSTQASLPMYFESKRGAIQMVLNRFLYSVHHRSKNLWRWRCIEYRRVNCPAYLDTRRNGLIISRKFPHNHKFHDEKIVKIGTRKTFYPSLGDLLDIDLS